MITDAAQSGNPGSAAPHRHPKPWNDRDISAKGMLFTQVPAHDALHEFAVVAHESVDLSLKKQFRIHFEGTSV